MPVAQQVRLLRVLESGEVWRVGETKPRPVDVRVIAANNRPLREQVARRRFRDDLYYRLAGASRHLPALRERPEDIEALTRYWAARLAGAHGGRAVSVSAAALKALRAQPWPGNARQLRSVLNQAVSLLTGPVLSEREITAALSETAALPPVMADSASKRARAVATLHAAGGNVRRAAALLRVHKATLYRRLRSEEPPDDAGGA